MPDIVVPDFIFAILISITGFALLVLIGVFIHGTPRRQQYRGSIFLHFDRWDWITWIIYGGFLTIMFYYLYQILNLHQIVSVEIVQNQSIPEALRNSYMSLVMSFMAIGITMVIFLSNSLLGILRDVTTRVRHQEITDRLAQIEQGL
jgi:magnesium-transporting ATPase (P-type)